MGLPQYKACNTLYVDCDILVKVENKSVLKAVKIVNKAGIESVKRMDNPLNPLSPSNIFLKVLSRMAEYRRKVGLSNVSTEVLLYAYNVYMNGNSGVTAYGLARIFTRHAKVTSELKNVRNKLALLERKGLLIKLGLTSNRCQLYIPSVKAIEDIENIFK